MNKYLIIYLNNHKLLEVDKMKTVHVSTSGQIHTNPWVVVEEKYASGVFEYLAKSERVSDLANSIWNENNSVNKEFYVMKNTTVTVGNKIRDFLKEQNVAISTDNYDPSTDTYSIEI